MQFATRYPNRQILIWLMWVIVSVVCAVVPGQAGLVVSPGGLAGMLADDQRGRWLVPWQPRVRFRKWAWRRYCALREARRRAVWMARLARLMLTGALTMAQVVDWLTQAQVRQHLGALPVLYALLETLQVREIINQYCPTEAQVDHGASAIVLIINRMAAPRPLYQVMDWLARTVLPCLSDRTGFTRWTFRLRNSTMTAWGACWMPSSRTCETSGKRWFTGPMCEPR